MIKTYITSEEIQKMKEAAPCLRDKVIIAFLSDTGCRVSEFLNVNISDIDFDKELVLISHLKEGIRKKCPGCGRAAGRKQHFCSRCGADISGVQAEGIQEHKRLISIGSETLDLIAEYIERRDVKSEKLMPISRQAVDYIIKDLAKRIGLDGKVILNPETGSKHFIHAHNFRDALCVDWLSSKPEGYTEDESRKALQRHLGHKRFDTTARYQKLTLDTVQDIGNIIRKKRFGEKKDDES